MKYNEVYAVIFLLHFSTIFLEQPVVGNDACECLVVGGASDIDNSSPPKIMRISYE